MALRLAVQITGDAAGLREGTEQAARGLDRLAQRGARAARRLASQMDQAGRRIQAIGQRLALAVTAPLVALGTVAVRAFDGQIQAERRLAAVIRTTGEAASGQLAIFKEFAAALQSITTVGDEVTLKNIQIARSMGLSAEQAARAARNAVALEGAFGRTAEEAIRAAAALEQGRTEPLGEVLPTLIAIEDQSERVAEAQRLLGDAFEVATESARVGLGPLRQLGNDLGDLAQQFGAIILDAINPFIRRMRGVVSALQGMSEETRRTIIRSGGIAVAIGPGLVALGLLTRGLGFALTGLVAFLAGTERVVRGIIAAMASLALAFTTPVGAAVAMSTAVVAAATGLRDTLAQIWQEIVRTAGFWLVEQWHAFVLEPFVAAVNAVRTAFGEEPIKLPPLITPGEAERSIDEIDERIERLRGKLDGIQDKLAATGDEDADRRGFFNLQAEGLVLELQELQRRRQALQELADFVPEGGTGDAPGSRIAAAFQRDVDRIQAKFQGVIDGIRERVPEGIWKAFFGDLEEVTPDIDRAQRRLNELIAQLPGGAGGGAGGGEVEAGSGRRSALGELGELSELEKLGETLQGIDGPVRDLNEELRVGGGLAQRLGDSLGSAFEQAVLGGRELRDVVAGLASDLQSLLVKRFVTGPQGLLQSALSGLGGLIGGGGGVDLPLIGPKFAGLEHGGRVAAGEPVIVGERRPELFLPDTAGVVLPRVPREGQPRAVGGERAGGNTFYIDNSNSTAESYAELKRALERAVGPGVIERRSVAGVSEAMQRGHPILRRGSS